MSGCLHGARVFLCPEGLGKKRRDLFAAQIARLGGRVAPHPRGATHLVLEGDAPPPPGAEGVLVSTKWLSECIKQGRRVSEQGFLVRKRAPSEDTAPHQDDDAPPSAKVSRLEAPRGVGCPEGGALERGASEECNLALLRELQKLADAYKNSGLLVNFL
jgi:hypothetical protein